MEARAEHSLNPDLAVALGAAPVPVQPALYSLWSLDEALGRVLATAREPMITRIRLAWWREGLERLDGEPPPREPVLEGVAGQLLPAGIAGADLAQMEEGWLAVVGDQPITGDELDTYGAKRGGLLFALSARLLGEPEAGVRPAGEAWALVDLARHSSERSDVAAALAAARTRALPRRWARPLRPLGMLAVLAARDLERGPDRWEEPGIPPRTARMLRHRLTGW
jgi:15-cis-phytoene synthase